MDNILSNLIVALRLGELMMTENLTWQAIGTYAVFFGIGGVAIAWGACQNGQGLEGCLEMSWKRKSSQKTGASSVF